MGAVKFHVWRLNECDWIWGTSFAQAVGEYRNQCGVDLEDLLGDEDFDTAAMKLSDETLERLTFHDEDENVKRTFKEELLRRVAAGDDVGFFASTEY